MSKFEKLLKKFLSLPKDFTYDQLLTLLKVFVYIELKGSGSRVVFENQEIQSEIKLHKPNPKKILKKYQIEIIIEELKAKELI